MIHWLYHYAWQDVYTPIWPNIAASGMLGLWALRRFIRIEKLHRHHVKKLEEIHDAIRNSQGRGDGELPGG